MAILKFKTTEPRNLTQAEVISNLQDRIIQVCNELEYNALEFAFMINFDDIELVEKVLAKKAYPTITMLNNIIKYLGISKIWLLDSDNFRLNFALKNNGDSKKAMFQVKPLTERHIVGYSFFDDGSEIRNLCSQEKFKNVILIVEDFEEADNRPRAMFVLEKNDVYQIMAIFNFLDISSFITRNYLKEILELNKSSNGIKFLIRAVSSEDFNILLTRNNHIGKYLIKASLDYTDNTMKWLEMILDKNFADKNFDEIPESKTKQSIKKILEFLEENRAEVEDKNILKL